MHAYVVELVQLVGRMFYRDEHVVVLDALTRELSLRHDGLEEYFGLPEHQVRRILADLEKEHLVCCEKVRDQRGKKKGARSTPVTLLGPRS
jgi:transcription initiation factor TFIIE subunit alpha